MGKETYRIDLSGHDEVTAFATAFGILGERETPKEDFGESTDFNNLESSFPPDTIQVATFLNKEYSTKKIYFYVCSFAEKHWEANHQEVYSLFSIMWDDDFSYWKLIAWYSCSVLSEQPQAPLHKEAANWMIKRMTTKGCPLAKVDDFKNGTLDVLI
mgnify:CR=1 FL=1